MRTIKFLDLTNPPSEAVRAVTEVISSGWYVSGPRVELFEDLWAGYCNAAGCVACASGGAALVLALRALKIPQGAKVILPALSFAATAMAVLEVGAQPVYCDVLENGLIDITDAGRATRRYGTWGIIPVHLYGQIVDMPPIMEFANAFGLRVIEDAAQAHGALEKVHGDAACFSFYPGKNLGAFGEAGAIVSDSKALLERVQALANYGSPKNQKHGHFIAGSNLRMDEIQAAVLAAKLAYLNEWNERRAEIASLYQILGVPSIATAESTSWHLYPVRVTHTREVAAAKDWRSYPKRVASPEKVREALSKKGIATGLHYPYILPVLQALYHHQRESWPVAACIAHNHITLPMGPHLTDEDVAYVAKSFRQEVQPDESDY